MTTIQRMPKNTPPPVADDLAPKTRGEIAVNQPAPENKVLVGSVQVARRVDALAAKRRQQQG